tara:strand:- start:471 stop:1007 length:537 start_codon:yes stop_codon:yes gene_type:complete
MLLFIDTETTGLSVETGQEIIDIAIISEHPDGTIDRWETLIRPERIDLAHPKALKVNGYTDAAWAEAPFLSEVAEEIFERLSYGNKIVVGHNIQFDMNFIRHTLKRHITDRKMRLVYPCIDTITLAHEHLTPMGLRTLQLDQIRKFMGWPMEGAHTAMTDAETVRRLYHSLIRRSWKG